MSNQFESINFNNADEIIFILFLAFKIQITYVDKLFLIDIHSRSYTGIYSYCLIKTVEKNGIYNFHFELNKIIRKLDHISQVFC